MLDPFVLCIPHALDRSGAPGALGLLRQLLPRAEVLELDGLGHLGPITHPERVDAAVEAFLLQRSPRWERSCLSHMA